jgi:tripeptide aminopeptidase
MLNVRRLIDQFKTLVAIDSVSGCEDKMRDFLMQEFNRRGYSAEEDQAGEIVKGKSGNLLVRIPGSIDAPAILFAAHMDTVEPGRGIKAVVSETDGIIRSEGDTILAADDKAAIAAIIEACDVLEEQHLEHPPIELLFTVGEEQGLQGSKLFDYSKLRARLAYVLDAGGDPGTIIVQSPCQNEIEYIV